MEVGLRRMGREREPTEDGVRIAEQSCDPR